MSGGQFPAWLVALGAGVSMLWLGMRTRMLAAPELEKRCPACHRLVRRWRTCDCARRHLG